MLHSVTRFRILSLCKRKVKLVGWLVSLRPRQQLGYIADGPRDRASDFCRSHYTDTDPTSRERAATAGIEPGTSSPGVAHSTAELPRPRESEESHNLDCWENVSYILIAMYNTCSLWRHMTS